MFLSLITIAHISICVILIGIVLLQQGKGADMGATFGGGSQTVFGASGADTLLTKVTTTLAFSFMLTSIVLAISANQKVSDVGGIFSGEPETSSAPVGAASAPAASSSDTSENAAPASAPSEPAQAAPAAAQVPAAAEATTEASPAE